MCVCVLLTFYHFYYLAGNLSILKLKARDKLLLSHQQFLCFFCGQLDAFDIWQKSAYLVSFLLLIREWWRAVFTTVLSANKRVICEPFLVRFSVVSYVFVVFLKHTPCMLIKKIYIVFKGKKRRDCGFLFKHGQASEEKRANKTLQIIFHPTLKAFPSWTLMFS